MQLWACGDPGDGAGDGADDGADDGDSCAVGHSAIFHSWLSDPSGEVIGVRFWSTWPGVSIGYQEGRFGTGGGFDADRSYAARLMPASAWRSPP